MRDLEGKNSGLEFDQDLTGTSRDVEGKYREQAKIWDELAVTSWDVEGCQGQKPRAHKNTQSLQDLRGIFAGARRKKLQCRIYSYIKPITLSQKVI